MISNAIFVLLLLGHVLGDFYFQTQRIAENKKDMFADRNGRFAFMQHIFSYLIVQSFFIFTLFGFSKLTVTSVLGISLSHAVIDFLKIWFKKNDKWNNKEDDMYLLDQLLHILIVFIASVCMFQYNIDIGAWIKSFLQIFCLENYDIINLGIAALLLGKPINITCKAITAKYAPTCQLDSNNNEQNAGALIGILERLLIVVMLYEGEYSAIALIFTAKSIVRYNKITEDKKFGEYYLLGSLISVLSSLIVYLLVM